MQGKSGEERAQPIGDRLMQFNILGVFSRGYKFVPAVNLAMVVDPNIGDFNEGAFQVLKYAGKPFPQFLFRDVVSTLADAQGYPIRGYVGIGDADEDKKDSITLLLSRIEEFKFFSNWIRENCLEDEALIALQQLPPNVIGKRGCGVGREFERFSENVSIDERQGRIRKVDLDERGLAGTIWPRDCYQNGALPEKVRKYQAVRSIS